MQSFSKILLASAVAAVLSTPAMAADSPWSSSAELGAVWTTGNTETNSINASLETKYTQDVWAAKARFDALTGEEKDQTTNTTNTSKEKYKGLLQFDRNITEDLYFTTQGWHERDRFSGFTYQSAVTAGFGYRVLSSDTQKLNIEVAPGYSRDRVKGGDVVDQGMGRFALSYFLQIREGVELTEEFVAEAGSENGIYTSETALKSQIAGNLASKIYYKMKNVEHTAAERNTDNEFGVNLVYNF